MKLIKSLGYLILSAALLGSALPARAEPLPPPHLGYGMMLAYPPGHLNYVTDAGFDWFKYFIRWNDVDPEHDGTYAWISVDARLDEACSRGLNLLLRVERDANDWTAIRDAEMDAWQAFFQALAARVDQKRAACGDGYRVAFEIWNEPNLDFQWNYEPVDPVRYTEMVRRAYLGTRAGDPTIPVVVGSLAPTGGLPDGRAMDDVAFLEAMYAAGLSGHFDVVSIHNYGYGGAPEDKSYGWNLLNFRRAEDIYQTLVAHGDGDKDVWATEFGWLLDSDLEGTACDDSWNASGFAWQQVSAEQQADYLQRAFAYADANWPWMGVMIVSNLDFSTTGWYATCDPLNWFAVLRPDKSARLAYTALQTLEKRTRSWAEWGMDVAPDAISHTLRLRDRRTLTESVRVTSTGSGTFDWSAAAGGDLPIAITPTTGAAGGTFTVTIDARDLAVGTHTGTLTVTASAEDVPQSPWVVPVTVDVWAERSVQVTPPALTWMMALTDTQPVSATVSVVNTGDYPFDWAVVTATQALTLSVTPAQGSSGTSTLEMGRFTVSLDPRGLPLGTYTATLTVTTTPTQVVGSPFTLPLRLHIVERVYPVYLPLIMKGG